MKTRKRLKTNIDTAIRVYVKALEREHREFKKDRDRLNFLAAGACIVQLIVDGQEIWQVMYDIDQQVKGATIRDALDLAIEAKSTCALSKGML